MRDNEFDNVSQVEETHFWFKNKRRLTHHFLNKYYNGGIILDSACGTGRDLKEFENCIGLDYSFYALNSIARRYCKILVNGDANNLPFKSKSFEIIFSFDLLQHKDVDFEKVMVEYNRVLKDGGYVFLNLPMFKFLYSKHDIAVNNDIRFEIKDFKRFKKYGFAIKEKVYWNFIFLPLIIFLRKFVFVFFSYEESSDVKQMNRITNFLLDKIFLIEFFLSKKHMIPLGISSFIVLRKEVDLSDK
ncbi:MAG: class I SAM-dependent methyltransferase [candidate division WOR-3 bacterium]